MGRRLALLIATDEFRDIGLRRLEAPAADVASLAAVLQDPEIAGFDVATLVNEPHHVVGEAIGDFYRSHRRDDLTVLYFTGHGLKDDGGRLYLAMSNTRRDNLGFTSLPAEQLDQVMQDGRSRQMVLILDCCYSGAFPPGRLAKADEQAHALEVFQGRGRAVLTASDSMQYSFEGQQLHGVGARSVFTRYLVDGLRDGTADLDNDGNITVDELYAYVYDRVVEEMPQQRPKKQDNVEGRMIIAQNINWRLPDQLRHALSSPIAHERLAALDRLEHLHRTGSSLARECALNEIHKLTDDDSRMVSASAGARLKALRSPTSSAEPIRATATRPFAPNSLTDRPSPAGPGRSDREERTRRPQASPGQRALTEAGSKTPAPSEALMGASVASPSKPTEATIEGARNSTLAPPNLRPAGTPDGPRAAGKAGRRATGDASTSPAGQVNPSVSTAVSPRGRSPGGRLFQHQAGDLIAFWAMMVAVAALVTIAIILIPYTAADILNRVTSTISVGSAPFGIAVTPDGRHAYTTNNGAGSVSVIDSATNRATSTIPVGERRTGSRLLQTDVAPTSPTTVRAQCP